MQNKTALKKPRRRWKIKPFTRVKTSKKIYHRQRLKNKWRKILREE